MAEKPNSGDNSQSSNNQGDGNDPKKTDTKAITESFDPSKLSDEDFEKIYKDKRLWTHDRFKKLSDRARIADELEKEKAEAEKKQLEDQQKFKELADKYAEEAKSWQEKYQQSLIDSRIQQEAIKNKVVDLDATLKLIDRSKIEVGEDGEIVGVDEAIKNLTESKPYLVDSTNSSQRLGSGSSPSRNTQSPPKFTHSQISDPKFYQEHEAEIDKALQMGEIDDDMA